MNQGTMGPKATSEQGDIILDGWNATMLRDPPNRESPV